MDAIILNKDEFQELLNRLNAIQSELAKKTQDPKETFVDNVDFMKLMHVSKRTAQSWRDEGKISFSQIGGKIYYRLDDIYEMLKKNYNKSFAYGR